MADILTAVLIPLVAIIAAIYPPQTDSDKLLYVSGFVLLSVLAILFLRGQRKSRDLKEEKDRIQYRQELRDIVRAEFAEGMRIFKLPVAQREPSEAFTQLV